MTTSSNHRLLELRLNKLELFATELQAIDLEVLMPRLAIITSTTHEVLSSGISVFDPIFHRLVNILDSFTLPYKSLQYKICEAKSLIVAKKAMMLDTMVSYELANEHLDSLYLRMKSEKVENGQLTILQEYRCRVKIMLSKFLTFEDSFMLHSNVNRILNEVGDSLPLSTITELMNLQNINPIQNAA